ncbi:MAG: SRPBCC family protein [Solirubrobacterales bacterium]|nr:SRPBCC family protein [Solirubrobacterales bacterium]
MKLEQSFEVAAPLEQVWRTLIDVEHVAPCLPGAAVTGRNEDGSYNGTFTVKIGPTTASYTGKLEMENIDEAAHTATMQAQGTDKRGQGGAKATIFSRVVPADGSGTRVDVVTDYHITGRLARFGRGGMIEDISERLLREFAKRLQSSLAAQPAAPAATVVSRPEPPAAPEPSAAPEPPRAPATVVSPSAASEPPQVPETVGSPPAPTEPAPPVQDEPAPWRHEPAPPAEPSPVQTAAEAPTEVVPPSEPPAPAAPPFEPPAYEPPLAAAPPPPPAAAPPPSPAAETRPPLENPPLPSEPMQGLSLMGSVIWGRVKRNPAPAAAAGVAVMLLIARLRRRRH